MEFHALIHSRQHKEEKIKIKSVYKSRNPPHLCVLFWVSLNTELGTSLPLKGDTGGKVRSYFPVTPFHIAFIYWIINLKLWPGKPHWGLLPAWKEESWHIVERSYCRRCSHFCVSIVRLYSRPVYENNNTVYQWSKHPKVNVRPNSIIPV